MGKGYQTVRQNEVRVRVRRRALQLAEFTVKQIVDATGLNPASVRTELSRLKSSGYLDSEPIREEDRGPGAPPHLYHLTDDVEKVQKLVEEVQRFSLPSQDEIAEPRGVNYQIASSLLTQVEDEEHQATEREELLNRISHHLSFAEMDEGIGIEEGPRAEVTAGYFLLLQAQLALANSDLERAREIVSEARERFSQHRWTDGLVKVEEVENDLVFEELLREEPDERISVERILTTTGERRGRVSIRLVKRALRQIEFQDALTAMFLDSLRTRFGFLDAWVDQDKVVIAAELPREVINDLDISAVGNTAIVSGERIFEELSEDVESHPHHHQMQREPFSRTLQLPFPIDADNVEASYANGILNVCLRRANRSNQAFAFFEKSEPSTSYIANWIRSRIRPSAEQGDEDMLEKMGHQSDQLSRSFFRRSLSDTFSRFPTEHFSKFTPSSHLTETSHEIEVTVKLPDMNEDDIEVILTHDSLTITGEKKEKVEDSSFSHKERNYSYFRRVIPLEPGVVDVDKVEATFESSVLTVTLPKWGDVRTTIKSYFTKID